MRYFRNFSLRKFVRKLGVIVAVSPFMASLIAVIFYLLGYYHLFGIDVDIKALFVAACVWLIFCVALSLVYDIIKD